MVKVYNLNDWSEIKWYNTGGTRNKKLFESPEGKLYYFKQSLYKPPKKDYKYEFWSEIIASYLGKMLGCNMLEYHVAYYDNIIGCLSESMIDQEKQELLEGVKYMQAIDNTFLSKENKPGNKYNFQFIENTLEAFNLSAFIDDIIEIIIFDALISNGDRHQENWAFIADHSMMSRGLQEIEFVITNKKSAPKFLKNIFKYIYGDSKNELREEVRTVKLSTHKNIRFSPIYDSGSSLGRELLEDKITRMIKDKNELDAYLNRGLSEIHWAGIDSKISHFELVKKLSISSYHEFTEKVLNRFESKFDRNSFKLFLDNIDSTIPEEFVNYKIPIERKEIIYKIVTLRADKLFKL